MNCIRFGVIFILYDSILYSIIICLFDKVSALVIFGVHQSWHWHDQRHVQALLHGLWPEHKKSAGHQDSSFFCSSATHPRFHDVSMAPGALQCSSNVLHNWVTFLWPRMIAILPLRSCTPNSSWVSAGALSGGTRVCQDSKILYDQIRSFYGISWIFKCQTWMYWCVKQSLLLEWQFESLVVEPLSPYAILAQGHFSLDHKRVHVLRGGHVRSSSCGAVRHSVGVAPVCDCHLDHRTVLWVPELCLHPVVELLFIRNYVTLFGSIGRLGEDHQQRPELPSQKEVDFFGLRELQEPFLEEGPFWICILKHTFEEAYQDTWS